MKKNSINSNGFNLSYAILILVTLFYTAVQSSARFFSTHPLFSINLASVIFSVKK